MSTDLAAAAYAQVLGLGLPWLTVHCAGMCGPVVVGLDVGGARQGVRPRGAALRVLAYQLGRSVTYACLGALAGAVGGATMYALRPLRVSVVLALGALALVVATARTFAAVSGRRARLARGPSAAPVASRIAAWVGRVGGAPGSASRAFRLGLVLGLMPCMIVGWALGLAAATRSPVHGAIVMVLLVTLTTPMLLGATAAGRLVATRRMFASRHVPTIALGVSGLWLCLVCAAAVGVTPHAFLPFSIRGAPFVVMLF